MDLPPSENARFRRLLLNWYEQEKRDLPWRRTSDPYRIWISEVMLQQTRAAAVIPYYERFLDRFPTVESLASASEQEVLALWAGLGYYSRARNLHKAAAIIHQSGFPSGYESIRALPGVGGYTAAAVASIAFHLPYAALDGNVLRVLSRLTAESGSIDLPQARARFRQKADNLLDQKQPGHFNQALMELGATVCLPKDPHCPICPLASLCLARQAGRQSEFPIRSNRKEFVEARSQILIVQRKDRVLCWQRPAASRRLASFWELPDRRQLPSAILLRNLGFFRHTIVQTRHVCEVWQASVDRPPKEFVWIAREHLQEIPLSTVAKKALACLDKWSRSTKSIPRAT